jgi:hypothetical protein
MTTDAGASRRCLLYNLQVDVWAHPTQHAHPQGIAVDTAEVERIVDRCGDREELSW